MAQSQALQQKMNRRVSVGDQSINSSINGIRINARLNDNLSQTNSIPNIQSNDEQIMVEDFDPSLDNEFIAKQLNPYLTDLYKDLLMRSNQQEHIDKVTFIEYTKLPGIINDRLHVMFSQNHFKNSDSQGNSPVSPISPSNNKESLQIKRKEEFVTEISFVRNFTQIFIGDLDQKMKFTFQM